MPIITVKHKGSFKKTDRFFRKNVRADYISVLNEYGKEGVHILRSATPEDSGETASKWGYDIEEKNGVVSLIFTNDNMNQGVNIVKIIVYGHGLWNGAYVQGNDFVRPSIRPLLTQLANKVWREVTK